MTLARNGRLALWHVVPAVAAVVALADPARAAFHQFETSVSSECAPNPPQSSSNHSVDLSISTATTTWGGGGLNSADLFARGGIHATTASAYFPGDLSLAARIAAEPSPEIASCTTNATATSRLRWELQGGSPTHTVVPLELRLKWGGVSSATGPANTRIHQTDADLGASQSATATFSARLIDLDGNVVTPLGEGTCDVTGCFSPVVAITEDSLDTSGQGYQERRWGISTGYIGFDVARGSSLAISIDWHASASLAGRFINGSSITVTFLDDLSYELVSLEPTISAKPMPEPALLSLLAAGAGAVAYLYRRRRD